MQPGRIITSAIGQNRCLGQNFVHMANDLFHFDSANAVLWCTPGTIGLMKTLPPGAITQRGVRFQLCQRAHHINWRTGNSLICTINTTQFGRVGIDMYQPLLWIWDIKKTIATAGDLTQTGAQRQNDVCLLYFSRQGRVNSYTDIARVMRMLVIKVILTPKRRPDRQLKSGGKPRQICGSLR